LDKFSDSFIYANRNKIFAAIISLEPIEPHQFYQGEKIDKKIASSRQSKAFILARIFGAMWRGGDSEVEINEDKFSSNLARKMLPPVRDYFHPERKSYGKHMKSTNQGFADLFHIGDDVGWDFAGLTVVAIADGFVRQAGYVETWGFIVIIEHQLPDLSFFCSLYAHLGPLLNVRPGNRIKMGDKIGVIGRGYTWENGGYAAHLHFAVHDGEFWQVPEPGWIMDVRFEGIVYRGLVLRADPIEVVLRIYTAQGFRNVKKSSSWVLGYISEDSFESNEHGWHDPQEFLLGYVQ
jgi:hypothetical protein